MGFILIFLNWIVSWIRKAGEVLLSFPGKVTLFCTTLVSTISGVIAFIINTAGSIAAGFDSASAQVTDLNAVVNSNPIAQFLGYICSVDVLFSYLVSLVGIGAGYISFVFLSILSLALIVYVIPFLANLTLRLVRLVSAGFVDP